MKMWYRIGVYRAHQGAGRHNNVTCYIFAENPIDVLNIYKSMPGVKKILKTNPFPNIHPISEEESLKLENRIKEEGRIPLCTAKRTWYYTELI